MSKSGHCRNIRAFHFNLSPFLYIVFSLIPPKFGWLEFDQKLLPSIFFIIRKCKRCQGKRWRHEQILRSFFFLCSSSFHNLQVLKKKVILLFRVFPPSLLKCPWNNIWKADNDQQCSTLWILLVKLLKTVPTTLLFSSPGCFWCSLVAALPSNRCRTSFRPHTGLKKPRRRIKYRQFLNKQEKEKLAGKRSCRKVTEEMG